MVRAPYVGKKTEVVRARRSDRDKARLEEARQSAAFLVRARERFTVACEATAGAPINGQGLLATYQDAQKEDQENRGDHVVGYLLDICCIFVGWEMGLIRERSRLL